MIMEWLQEWSNISEHLYMLFPGPPKEMEPMFLTYAKPLLLNKLQSEDKIVSRVLTFFWNW